MSNLYGEEQVAQWRSNASIGNPAGALFISGEFAEADITCDTWTGSGKCGTACSWSATRECC